MDELIKASVGTFAEELQRLMDYGHDCCARVDDRIHEQCGRIMEAHDNEISSYQLALRWKEEQDAMDAGRCGGTSAGGGVPAADRCRADCAGDQLAEGVAPITGELRGAMENGENRVQLSKCLFGYLCDNIDAVHNGLERENKKLRHDIEMWRDRAEDMRMERDDALKEHHAWAPESHYMMLPKDADGEPIHIGDMMEGVDKYDSLKKVMGKVITISFESDGTVDVAVQAWNDDGKSWHRAYLDQNASVYRHYHAPTVEDVLREFALTVCKDDALTIRKDVVDEYAAKLQLSDADA